jgi:thymidylate synthase (FAD)
MHRVEPQVFLIAENTVNDTALHDYLKHIGAVGWTSKKGNRDGNVGRNGQGPGDLREIIEVMGRGCYKSFGTDLNPNLTRVRESNEAYLENIINIGHGSVLEHGWVSFMICDTSRVVTHELVRHRAGTAISQESLRFLRLEDMGLWMPQAYAGDADSTDIFEETWEYLELQYTRLIERAEAIEGQAFDSLPFSTKKYYTSAARRVLPIGVATNIGWSCNIRAARHIIEMRTDEHAEEEIRLVFNKIGDILKDKYPVLFSDYAIEVTGADNNKEWATIRRKV